MKFLDLHVSPRDWIIESLIIVAKISVDICLGCRLSGASTDRHLIVPSGTGKFLNIAMGLLDDESEKKL
jgi:hypothetical protein